MDEYPRVERDVGEVVETGEQAHLGELAHPGDEAEADVGVAVLDDRVQAAQVVAVRAGHLRHIQGIENRLVVLVDEYRYPPAGPPVQRPDHMGESGRSALVACGDSRLALLHLQEVHHCGSKVVRSLEVPGAEAQPYDGVAHGPVPSVVDGESLEQPLAALEQLLAGVEEQALAEAPRTREEVVLAFVEQAVGCRPSCRRSSSPVRVSRGRSGCRWEVCVWSSWLRVRCPFGAVVGRALLLVVTTKLAPPPRRRKGTRVFAGIMRRWRVSRSIWNRTINWLAHPGGYPACRARPRASRPFRTKSLLVGRYAQPEQKPFQRISRQHPLETRPVRPGHVVQPRTHRNRSSHVPYLTRHRRPPFRGRALRTDQMRVSRAN